MDVQIIDAAAENLSVEQTVVEIKEYKPDIVGMRALKNTPTLSFPRRRESRRS
jgi:hypothetical protein